MASCAYSICRNFYYFVIPAQAGIQ